MNWLAKAAKALTSMRHGGRPSFFGSLLKRTRFDYRREVGDCLDASVVTAPALWIARAMTEAMLSVERKKADGGTEPRSDHPMLALIQKPNEAYGDIALWMVTALMFAIFGNAYWLIVRNSYGKPVELWWVPNWMIEPKWPADGSAFISHYEYRPGGGVLPEDLDPQDVVHFRHGIDPRNIRMGLSPLDGVIREIFIDLESSNFVASLLRNMGVPGVVISPKNGAMATTDDVEATAAWFNQKFGGDGRGKPLVMGAPTDVQSFGFNPQQLNMSEGRDVAEERVCACLGIPAAVVGFGAGLQQTKVGATMEELRKLAWNNGVLPFARMLADELQRSLLGEFGVTLANGMTVFWDTSDVNALQEDEDKRTERLNKQLAAGAITLFEWRQAMGYPADDSHKIYLRTISTIEVPQAGARSLPAPKEKAAASSGAMARGQAFAEMIERQGEKLQEAFETPLIALFERFGQAAGDAAIPMLEADPTLKAKERGEKADELLVEMILDKLGIAPWQGELRTLYEGQYLEVAKAVSEAADRAGLGASLPDIVARSIVAAGGRRAGLIDLQGQTRAGLFKALAEGRAEGEGAAQLAARIVSQVQGGPWNSAATRAKVIARTETKYAQNISTIERARAAGVTSLIVYDGRLGPGRSLLTHIARNGSIVSIDEGLVMAAAEHPNGTLSFAPNFEED